jgi:hypothetical protein
MAPRAIIRDDDPERDQQQSEQQPSKPPVAPKLVHPVTGRTQEEIHAFIDAVIDEEWERMEPSMRYLADR